MSAIPPVERPRQLTVGEALARMRLTSALAGLGAVIVAAGSLGPWVTTALGSVSGVDGGSDGWVTLGAAVVAVVSLLSAQGRRWGSVTGWLMLVGALGVACYDGARVIYATSKLTFLGFHLADAGWGLYVVAGGAALGALALSFAAVTSERDERGALLTVHDYRVGLAVLVALAAGGAVAGGLVVEHKHLKSPFSTQTPNPTPSVPTPTPSVPNPNPVPNPTPAPSPPPDPSTFGAPVTGTDQSGYNTGQGCTDNPSSSLPGCADSPSVPSGDSESGCPGGVTVDATTTSCDLAANVVSSYTSDGTVTASDPAQGQSYQFDCFTGGTGTTGYTFCLGQDGSAKLYLRWHR